MTDEYDEYEEYDEFKRPVEEFTKHPVEEFTTGDQRVEPCNAPAPLVVNGAQYIGCRQVKGHEGSHEVKINWPR